MFHHSFLLSYFRPVANAFEQSRPFEFWLGGCWLSNCWEVVFAHGRYLGWSRTVRAASDLLKKKKKYQPKDWRDGGKRDRKKHARPKQRWGKRLEWGWFQKLMLKMVEGIESVLISIRWWGWGQGEYGAPIMFDLRPFTVRVHIRKCVDDTRGWVGAQNTEAKSPMAAE